MRLGFKIKGGSENKKNKLTAREETFTREPSTRDWLPIDDVSGSVIKRRDGCLVAVLKVEPLNVDLKSVREKKRIIKTVHEVFNGQREVFQIMSIGRPVDLDGYLQELEVMVGKADAKRKRHLREYVRHVAGIVTGGEALEHRYYVLLSQEPDSQARDELLKRSYEMAAGLKVDLCQEREIIDLYFHLCIRLRLLLNVRRFFPARIYHQWLTGGWINWMALYRYVFGIEYFGV